MEELLFFSEAYPESFTISENHVDNCDVAFGIRIVSATPLYQFGFVAVALMGILYEGTRLCLLPLVFHCSLV